VPQSLPALDAAALRGLAGLSYAALAARIVALFAGEAFAPAELRALSEAAYGTFRHAAVAPLVQLDERLWLLELFHGPTLASRIWRCSSSAGCSTRCWRGGASR